MICGASKFDTVCWMPLRRVLSCWMSLCRVSLCWMSLCRVSSRWMSWRRAKDYFDGKLSNPKRPNLGALHYCPKIFCPNAKYHTQGQDKRSNLLCWPFIPKIPWACVTKTISNGARHDQNPRFSKSLSHLKIFYTHLTPVISCLLTVNTMLPTR